MSRDVGSANKPVEKPPRFARAVLRLLLRREDREDRTGDFEEGFAEIARSAGRKAADHWFRAQILRSVPGLTRNAMIWGGVMVQNYARLALRHMRRHKIYALLNVAGLAVGMAVFILMALYVDHESGFDGFHDRADRTYRVVRRYDQLPGQTGALVGGTPAPLAPTMRREFAEVEDAARLGEVDGLIRLEDRSFSRAGFYADDGFFRLFRFPLVAGDPATALIEPNAVVLSRRLARTLFGREDPLGRIISFSQRLNVNRPGSRNERFDLKVAGIVADLPGNSHLRFDFLISFGTIASLRRDPAVLENWGASTYYSYVVLRPGTRPGDVLPRLADYSPRFRGRDPGRYILQHLRKIHWEPVLDDAPGNRTNDRKLMSILMTIAFFILFIAGVNSTNLAVARFSKRIREIGIRKVVGARKSQLVVQFLGESLAFSFAALAAAAGSALLALPMFNGLVERGVQAARLFSPVVLLTILSATLLTGVLSGLYPALTLASLSPAFAAKGRSDRKPHRSGVRGGLIVLQFAVSIFLLTGMFIVFAQMRFIRTKDIGYDKENVIVLPLRDGTARKSGDGIKAEILRFPNILAAAGSEYVPLERDNLSTISVRDGYGEVRPLSVSTAGIGYDFLEVYKLRLLRGRGFSPAFATDARSAVILNETAAKLAGWEEPIGQTINASGHRVIGVVADWHQSSLHDGIEPMMFLLNPQAYSFLSVRIATGDPGRALESLKNAVETRSPDFPFEYYFQDQYLDALYKSDERFGRVFAAASVLALLVAGLGVFGLVSFAAERRTREIAVRRVLGASPGHIVRLLSRKYLGLAVPACLMAWPASWLFMNQWLRSFAFRASIRVWMFVLAGCLAAVIAWAAAATRSLSAAGRSPADSLRVE